jgi:hypothetical protein
MGLHPNAKKPFLSVLCWQWRMLCMAWSLLRLRVRLVLRM